MRKMREEGKNRKSVSYLLLLLLFQLVFFLPQWSPNRFGGFSSAKPWLPVSRDHLNPKWNVKDATKDENSTLNLIKNMADEKGR